MRDMESRVGAIGTVVSGAGASAQLIYMPPPFPAAGPDPWQNYVILAQQYYLARSVGLLYEMRSLFDNRLYIQRLHIFRIKYLLLKYVSHGSELLCTSINCGKHRRSAHANAELASSAELGNQLPGFIDLESIGTKLPTPQLLECRAIPHAKPYQTSRHAMSTMCNDAMACPFLVPRSCGQVDRDA